MVLLARDDIIRCLLFVRLTEEHINLSIHIESNKYKYCHVRV